MEIRNRIDDRRAGLVGRLARWQLLAAATALALAAACVDEPEDVGQLELGVEGESSEFTAYLVSVLDATTGKVLAERSLEIDQLLMPPISRFLALLPANRKLLIEVTAENDAGEAIGSGGALVTLMPLKRTIIQIIVLAHPIGATGILDSSIQPADYPTREYLLVDPATNKPGGTQTMVARLTDRKTGAAVTDAFTLFLEGAVAPMFTPEPDGAVATTFEWADFDSTITPRWTGAYLDGKGRGWVASVTAHFTGVVAPSDIDASWDGVIPASGKLAGSGGRWLLGFSLPDEQRGKSAAVAAAADADGDGVFESGTEVLNAPVGPNTMPLFFTATNPSGITAPIDLAGVIFASAGKLSRDSMLTIDSDGVITLSPWPPPIPE